MTQEAKSYEEKMEKLANILSQLEEGSLPLEKNIALYEEGMNVYKELKEILSNRKGKIQKILQENDEFVEFRLHEEDTDGV